MILFLLRGVFLVLVAAVAALYLLTNQEDSGLLAVQFFIMLLLALGFALGVVFIDAASPNKKLSSVSGIFLGLAGGLLAAFALSFVVDLFGVLTAPEVTLSEPQYTQAEKDLMPPHVEEAVLREESQYRNQVARHDAYLNLLQGVKVLIGLITTYIGISLVLQTKDDFRFVIPYVEFAKETRGNRPILLDTSAIIDGRIVDLIETRIVQGTVVVPKFVLNELQTVADSGDKIKRVRGRRGLDMLQKLQSTHIVEVHIDESVVEGAGVDQKLITLALDQRARIMTNDFNLNKVATLRGVEVINLNDIAQALKPVVLPGEHMQVKIVKPGESHNQGVGYLDDGTMVVVEHGRGHIGDSVAVEVTSTLQTSAGRMIFGRIMHDSNSDDPPATPEPASDDPEPEPGPRKRSPRAAHGRNPRRTN